MEYIIPCRGKRRRIVSSDDVKEDDALSNATGINEQHNRIRAQSEASTAATNTESDTDEDEDPLAKEANKIQNEIILKKLQRVNGEGDEVQLLHTSSRAKLFEYVKGTGNDVINDNEGTWTYRGEGQVKFIRCLEEGYNRGMIRMELAKKCTLEILMCNEVTHEEAVPMTSNKGKAYTWICKDWAYTNSKKTFALRFDDSMQALEWKQMFEQSKINNCNVRRGIGVPDEAAVDDVTATFKSLSTAAASSPS